MGIPTARSDVTKSHVIALSAVAALSVCGLWPPAAASVYVRPSIIRPVIRAGSAVDFELKVSHDDPAPRDFEVKITNMTAAPQGFPVSAPEDDPHGCAQWLTISPTKFSLARNVTQVVPCRLRAPRGTRGGYYALITVSSPSPQPRSALEPRSGAVRVTQVFGVAILASVPGRGLSVRLRPERIRLGLVRASASGGAGWVLEAAVRNAGNIHAKVQGKFELRSAAGRVIARTATEAGSGTVLASAVRRFRARGPQHLSDGVYLARAEFVVPGTRIGAASMQPFAIHTGELRPIEPTEDIRALMASLVPKIQLSPQHLAMSASCGSRTSGVVTLTNLSTEPIDLSLALCHWQLSADGEDEFPDALPEHGRSALAWLSTNPARITLRPRARGGVRVIAAVPKESAHGDYFACLRVREADAAPSHFDPSYVTVRVSVGRNTEAACEISEFTIERPNTPGATAKAVLTNSGECIIWPTLTLSISDSEGKRALPPTSLGPHPCMILPGQMRRFSLPLDLLRPGRYEARLVAIARENGSPVSRGTAFDAPQWATGANDDTQAELSDVGQ